MSWITLLYRSSRFFELHCACNWLHIIGTPLHMPGAQRPLPVLCPQVNFTFLCIHREFNVFSLFFTHKWISHPHLVPGSSTGSPVHSCSGSLRRTQPLQRRSLLCLLYIFGDTWFKSTLSQMESVLLSTGLPYASDFASHLSKITHDDHCKYGNTSVAMEI